MNTLEKDKIYFLHSGQAAELIKVGRDRAEASLVIYIPVNFTPPETSLSSTCHAIAQVFPLNVQHLRLEKVKELNV